MVRRKDTRMLFRHSQSMLAGLPMHSEPGANFCGNSSGASPRISASSAPVGSAYVVPSAVSKAGVEALTRSLAVVWGNRGIRMNAIAPGPIPTQGAFSRVLPRADLEVLALDRNPLHRFGTTEELANLAAFLVSDGSSYINGEVIRMDGGEFLQGAGEFSNLGRALTPEDWESLKPRKSKAEN